MPTAKICRHCQVRPASRPRSLCWRCYYQPGIRDKYQTVDKNRGNQREPTLAELDRMIQEQLPTMPDRANEDFDVALEPKREAIRILRRVPQRGGQVRWTLVGD